MPSSSLQQLTVREYQPGDADAFRIINEAWITEHFRLEPKDVETLSAPETAILDNGGKIFFAVLDGVPVGCCALLAMGPGEFEVAKMGVLASTRGHGAGRLVLQATVDWAREHGARRLYLETNRKLDQAIHLYRSVGFEELPPERVTPSPYARANVYMELWLNVPRSPQVPGQS